MGDGSETRSNIVPEREKPGGPSESGSNALFSFENNSKLLLAMTEPNPAAVGLVKGISKVSIISPAFDSSAKSDKRGFALPVNDSTKLESEIGSTDLPGDPKIQLLGNNQRESTAVQTISNVNSNRDQGTDVRAPQDYLDRAKELENHVDIQKDAQGRPRLSAKGEVRDSAGRITTNTDSPDTLNRKINENYLAALQTAAESEPARKQALAQIDQQIEDAKKSLNLDHTPSRQELEDMKEPENLAKLTPAQRQSFAELEKLVATREDLDKCSLKNVEKRYEDFLERTGQTDALARFKQFKPILETLPFQDWLDKAGRSTLGQSEVRDENNPFSSYRKAVEALHSNPPNREMADRYFNQAIKAAEKLDPKMLDAEMDRVKKEMKTEKEKAEPDKITMSRLEAEEKALALLKASPGLMRIAYADFLINSGQSDKAFHQLIAAADNPAAVTIVNKNNRYFEQLTDRSLHGDKNMVAAANHAATHLQDFNEHFNLALGYAKSGDKQKAEEEFQAAYKAAEKARTSTSGMDNRELAQNARLYSEAIKEEKNKPPEKQNQEKIAMLEQQRQYYQTLAHLPALASLAQAKAELTVSTIDGKVNTDRDATVRGLIAEAEADPTLCDIAGIKQQLDYIKDIVHEQSYGEMSWDYLRRNSGSIAALSAGFAVAGLTCWSGPGAALAGAAAAAAVAGTATDWACGNEVNLESFGGHCFEGAGGGLGRVVRGGLAARGAISRIPKPLVGPAIGAASAGATGAIEHFPDLLKDPLTYIPKVSLDAAAGAVLNGPRAAAVKVAPRIHPVIQSPALSHVIKAPITESLFGSGSEIARRGAYILNMP